MELARTVPQPIPNANNGNVDMVVLEQVTEMLMSATVSFGGSEGALAQGAGTDEGAGGGACTCGSPASEDGNRPAWPKGLR